MIHRRQRPRRVQQAPGITRGPGYHSEERVASRLGSGVMAVVRKAAATAGTVHPTERRAA